MKKVTTLGRLIRIMTTHGTDTIQNNLYSYDLLSNLAARTDSIHGMSESFIYDNLNRLTGIVEGNDTTGMFVYDAYGRMLSKYIHGAQVFDSAEYNGGNRPHAIAQAKTPLDLPVHQMSYTHFDKLAFLGQDTVVLRYGYGFGHERLHLTETDLIGDTLRQKDYVGNCEYVTNDSDTIAYTYLSGPLGVFGVQEGYGNANSHRYFIHPDHLGSWTLITDNAANIVQDVAFDVWGTPYRFTATGTVPADSLLFDRGFTGHEHLLYFGLINMNGRMYDPFTSGFLSVDNYVQNPEYTQSFNRYSYCLNNPLVYVDPSGEKWWHWALSDMLSGGFLSSTALVTAEFALTTITTAGVTAYTMPLPYGETGYMKQKYDSPIAFQLDMRYGTHQRGIGFNISIGLPKILPYAKRWEWGSSYYWKNYGNYRGYEHRKGSEQSVLGFYHWGKTHYESGEFTQTVGNKNFGMPSIAGVDISNDLWGDQGDRFRTSYQRINFGPIRIENAIFTGDPGPSGKRFEYTTMDYGGIHGTYTGDGNPYEPDKYRHGVLSIGIGPLNFGADTEGIRSGIQNWFHDTKWGDAPHFRDLRGTPEYEAMGGDKFYFQFGYYRIW